MANMKMLAETTYSKQDVINYLDSTGYPFAKQSFTDEFGNIGRATSTRIAKWFMDYFPGGYDRMGLFREMQATCIGHMDII